MKWIATLCTLLFSFLNAHEDSRILHAELASRVLVEAKAGDPSCQFLFGLMLDLGIGLEQDSKEAVHWYLSAAEKGCTGAQRRLGTMYFWGEGIEQDKHKGLAFVLMASGILGCKKQKDFFHEDVRTANWLASLCMDSISVGARNATSRVVEKARRRRHLSNGDFHFTSDRWDPMDANERVYGKGTHDGNTGILKSELAEMQRQRDLFVEEISNLEECVDLTKFDTLREKIEALQKEADAKGYEALSAGAAIYMHPIAVLSAWFAVDSFKDAAKDYLESIDIKKQVEGLLEMERSLERIHETQSLSDRRR